MKKAKQAFWNRLLVIAGIIAVTLLVFVVASAADVLTGITHVVLAGASILTITNFTSKSLQELKELRGEGFQELEDILKKCETEKRDLTDDEVSKRDSLLKALEKLDKEIRIQEDIENKRKEYAGKQMQREKKNEEDRANADYSFAKAIREKITGELSGLELEMHQEAVKEARGSGMKIAGIGIPHMVLQKRDVTATGQTTNPGDQGGVTIPTIKTGFIDVLRARMVMAQLGVQFLTGLSGNVSIPRKSSASSASWGTENATATETQPLFNSIELSPKRLAAFTEMSSQLIMQSSLDIETLIRNDLEMAVRLALEAAAINGPGTSNTPKGILNVSGIGSVPGGTNGAIPTWDNIIALESAVAVANADLGSLGYLTNPKIRGKLKATPKVASYPEYIWQNGDSPLNGYKAAVTTQVPSNLTKGTASGICSALIFGNFNDLIIGQWGGLDIVVDPYTGAKSGIVNVVVNSFWDIATRHAESFSAMVDALSA